MSLNSVQQYKLPLQHTHKHCLVTKIVAVIKEVQQLHSRLLPGH